MLKRISKTIGYLLYLFVVVFIGLEIFLHIYNPFPFRQKADKIILPRNRTMIFSNDKIPVLEKKTVHKKNSLGFRGPEMPSHFNDLQSYIAVGGSATECFFLSDSNCWTNRLANTLRNGDTTVWINNAGYQGHSTYGHLILINDYIKQLHPKHILLMAGYNEINRGDIMKDESVLKNSSRNSTWGWIKRNSEVINIMINIQRRIMADKLSVTDGYLDLAKKRDRQLVLTEHQIDSTCMAQQPLVEAYKRRLTLIIDTCLSNKIDPILVTQPILFGKGIDSVTGVDLEKYKISDKYNGLLWWRLLETYNDVTRSMASEKNLSLIDLAKEMPKSSLYFYDICHFSNEGCKKVSEILAGHIAD